jgi:hypothetical protein
MQGDDHPVGVVISFSRTRVIGQVLLEEQPREVTVLAGDFGVSVGHHVPLTVEVVDEQADPGFRLMLKYLVRFLVVENRKA